MERCPELTAALGLTLPGPACHPGNMNLAASALRGQRRGPCSRLVGSMASARAAVTSPWKRRDIRPGRSLRSAVVMAPALGGSPAPA